jgi:lipid II:glycine glycyltransferase (peptidoglycan interpeptide bridge formation enzyme)
LNISFLDPVKTENWDKLILSFPSYSFFHSSDWAKVLQETYNFKPHYLKITESGRIKAVLPLMEVDSLFTGRRAVSLPFSDFCEPLISHDVNLKRLRHDVMDYSEQKGFNSVEFRDSEVHLDNSIIIPAGYQHILDLSYSEEQLFKQLSDTTRRNIKKAIKNKVSFEINNSPSALEDFYMMNCYTRRRHGLPPQPIKFFRKLYDFVLTKNRGFICISKYDGKSIASAVFLLIGQKALFKYGASLFQYQNFRPNNLLMWESIKYLKDQGFRELNFGRTELENIGLRRFKLGWGTEEKILNYYRFELGKNGKISASTKSLSQRRLPLHRFPIFLLKIIGSIVYKHFAKLLINIPILELLRNSNLCYI